MFYSSHKHAKNSIFCIYIYTTKKCKEKVYIFVHFPTILDHQKLGSIPSASWGWNRREAAYVLFSEWRFKTDALWAEYPVYISIVNTGLWGRWSIYAWRCGTMRVVRIHPARKRIWGAINNHVVVAVVTHLNSIFHLWAERGRACKKAVWPVRRDIRTAGRCDIFAWCIKALKWIFKMKLRQRWMI